LKIPTVIEVMYVMVMASACGMDKCIEGWCMAIWLAVSMGTNSEVAEGEAGGATSSTLSVLFLG